MTNTASALLFLIDSMTEGHSLEEIENLDISTLGEFAEDNSTTIESILEACATMREIKHLI